MILSEHQKLPYEGTIQQHSAWISEAIWGHRIERQPASGLLLEFLGMANGMYRQGKLLDHETGDTNYTPYLSTQLRNLLFNNPNIEKIAKESGPDEEAWSSWLEEMKGSAVADKESLRDYSFLRERFDSFDSFKDVVLLLRNIAMDAEATRGWIYTLLYPIGPAAFYDEVSLRRDKSGFERTHVLFTRTGELAYLMLSRARHDLRGEIAASLATAFDPKSPKNKLLLHLMADDEPDTGGEKSGTYLPYATHPAYDRLAEDVRALFRLGLPGADTFNHLGALLAFHLLLYQFETANGILGNEDLPSIICELLAPKNNLVRRASVGSISDNESLGMAAVACYIEDVLKSDADLTDVLKNSDTDESYKVQTLKEGIRRLFSFSLRQDLTAPTVEEVRQEFHQFARESYSKTVGDAVRSLADQCGLRSKQRTTHYRYAPSDPFLRNLVYVNVTKPVKESEFLAKIYERYRLVIGPEEAVKAVREELYDKVEFDKNNGRLLRRLMAMGLARRMSDSFTYIINPIADRHAL